MEYLGWFPHINASLNALSGIFLVLGFTFIRLRMIRAHRACMLTAVSASTLFLACYLFYHFFHGTTKFQGQGDAVRYFYFILLGTHTVLAAVVAPFILVTLWRALKGKFDMHRRIARWTFPIWLYVSITGVLVYLMLYQIYR